MQKHEYSTGNDERDQQQQHVVMQQHQSLMEQVPMNSYNDGSSVNNIYYDSNQQTQHQQQQLLLFSNATTATTTSSASTRTTTAVHKLKFLVLGAAGAGKTSLLRRYFYKQFDWTRFPTLGSDFYTTKVTYNNNYYDHEHDGENDANNNNIINESNNTNQIQPGEPAKQQQQQQQQQSSRTIQVTVQMWDTPGRERYANNSRKRHRYAAKASSLSESFFQQADAVMLVYDMTSSTSFKQLLKWYADLIELFRKQQEEQHEHHHDNHNYFGKLPPILICANKLDLYIIDQQQQNNVRQCDKNVKQRDVFGFGNKKYRGYDFQWEYQVCPVVASNRGSNNVSSSSLTNNNLNNIVGVNNNIIAGSSADDDVKPHRRRMEISSYLANRENWTTDGSYLESLLHSEDISHPDREMVLLWCLRNGLKHCEVSAATGQGVDESVNLLIELALQAKKEYESNNNYNNHINNKEETATTSTTTTTSTVRRNETLDLQERYSSHKEKCCFCDPRPFFEFIFQPFDDFFSRFSR